MEEVVPPPLATTRRKQLLFDRRYGWVYEEWTDPVEVANIGGRGMFSLVPLTAATIDGILHLANLAADAVTKTLQSHQLPQWPFQSKHIAEKEETPQVGTTGVSVIADREEAPQVGISSTSVERPIGKQTSFVKFARRTSFDVINEE